MLLACVTVIVHAGPYYTGLNQLDKLLKAVGDTEHPDPENSDNDAWRNNFGFTFTTDKVKPTWSEDENFYMLLTIEWGGLDYVQTDSRISLEHAAAEKEDLSQLHLIDFSNNQLRDIFIDGKDVIALNTVDLSNNPTLEALEIINCPNLSYVDVEGCDLTIPAIADIRDMISLKEDGTFQYEFQGNKQAPMAAVDLNQVITANGPGTVADWSVEPVSVSGNVYEFDQSEVELTLSNAEYPYIEITYHFDLLAGTPVSFNLDETLCSITIENITNPGIIPVIGDEVKIKVRPSSGYYNFISFEIDNTAESLDSNNEYIFELTEDEYTIAAEYDDSYSGTGEGTLASPYQISNQLQLNQVRYDLNAYYELANNITLELSGEGWEAIQDFEGDFDGKGKTISGLMINRPSSKNVGLFGIVKNGAEIKNLTVLASSISAKEQAGGIAGRIENSTIKECYFHGTIECSGNDAGGIAGYVSGGSSLIENCYTSGSVTANDRPGGVIGLLRDDNAEVRKCYSTSEVLVTQHSGGGVVGSYNAGAPKVTACFALNPSVGDGNNDTKRIIGYDKGSVKSNNYALNTLSLKGSTISESDASNSNGADITSTEARTKATYVNVGWDFDNVWTMRDTNADYPLPILKGLSAEDQPLNTLVHLPGGPITDVTNDAVQGLKVYPRQTNDLLYIQNKEVNSVVTVFNLSGVKLMSSKEPVLNLSTYTNGIYFVQVEDLVVKIVKN